MDVASFQGQPAHWAGPAGDIAWAAVKFTELQPSGHAYVNPDAAADWAFLKQRGLGRIAYMFGHPSVSVKATVIQFVAEVLTCGLEDGDGVCLDLEVTDGQPAHAVAAWAGQVMSLLQSRLGRQPLLYTYRSFAAEGNCAGLGGYPLWIADPSAPAPGKPRVPVPWRTWLIHQYAISGGLDRDIAAVPAWAQVAAVLGSHRQQPARDTKGPVMRDLGGGLATATGTALAMARWDNGVTVLAGVRADGSLVTRRWTKKDRWGPWRPQTAADGPVASGPVLCVWGTAAGRLAYVSPGGHVIELTTGDSGVTWH